MARVQGIDDVREKRIFNLAALKPADALDFCGACHKGTQTPRFQPYWLQQSKCWGENGDARLTCTVSHDPHKPLETDPESYDKACLGCHARQTLKMSPQLKAAPARSARKTAPRAICPVFILSRCSTPFAIIGFKSFDNPLHRGERCRRRVHTTCRIRGGWRYLSLSSLSAAELMQ